MADKKVVTVKAGKYKGAVGYVSRKYAKTVVLTLIEDFHYEDNDDDGWNDEDFEAGDSITVSKVCLPSDVTGDMDQLNSEIAQAAISLRGLLPKKKLIEHPEAAVNDIEKIMSCLEV